VLSGKYSRDDLGPKPPGDPRNSVSRKDINIATWRLTEHNLEIAAVVSDVAAEMGVTSAQAALAWTLLNPAVVSPLIGARTFPQLEDNLAALNVSFSDAQIARLDSASKIELGFPHDLLKDGPASMMFGRVKVAPRS
jgi:aryl-alcohol dehydrogenase-like predicted oxidoreductase